MTKRPRLTDKEIVKEVYNRVGQPLSVVEQIVFTYYEVIRETVNSGVEAKSDLGVFSWNIKPPRKHISYNNPKTGERIEKFNTDGFVIPKFKPSKRWKDELKKITLYEYEEKEERKDSG